MEKERDAISYMDCWHLIAPLLLDTGILRDPLGLKAYVLVFNALKRAEDEDRRSDKDC